mgnify:FL=1|tara:strand:+ start:2239 stop:2532 length:294 start_codon:yes stop_codon:yes gene_type:complete
MNTEVTVDLLEKYISITKKAKEKATPLHNEGTPEATRLDDMLRMCDDYTSDAGHFMEKGDLVRAFGAINYAHAWIDAAVRIGLLDGHGDDQLFTLPP